MARCRDRGFLWVTTAQLRRSCAAAGRDTDLFEMVVRSFDGMCIRVWQRGDQIPRCVLIPRQWIFYHGTELLSKYHPLTPGGGWQVTVSTNSTVLNHSAYRSTKAEIPQQA